MSAPTESWQQTLERGISDAFNARGAAAGFRPLRWRIGADVPGGVQPVLAVHGQAGAEYLDSEIPAVLAAWAAVLGIVGEATHPEPGLLEYTAVLYPDKGRASVLSVDPDRLHVTLWGIDDRAAFGTERTGGAR